MAREIVLPTGYDKLDDFWTNVVLKRFPDAKLYDKFGSWFMRALYIVSFMWIWQRRFMAGYTTTIKYDVYVAEDIVEQQRWAALYQILRHEFIHMLQREKHGIWFTLGYIFPQILSLLAVPSLLAIWFGPWFLLGLIPLVSLAPFPAHWRAKFEMEGYTQTLLVEYEEHGSIREGMIKRISKHFTSSDYYFMRPSKKVLDEFNSIVLKILDKNITGFYLGY